MILLNYIYSCSLLFNEILILTSFNYESDPNLIRILILILCLVMIAIGIYKLVETIIKQIKKEMKKEGV